MKRKKKTERGEYMEEYSGKLFQAVLKRETY